LSVIIAPNIIHLERYSSVADVKILKRCYSVVILYLFISVAFCSIKA